MNKIFEKALHELKSETPRLDYVIGMLETLIEMQDPQKQPKMIGTPTAQEKVDEATILEANARNSVDIIRRLAEQGMEHD